MNYWKIIAAVSNWDIPFIIKFLRNTVLDIQSSTVPGTVLNSFDYKKTLKFAYYFLCIIFAILGA